MKIKRLGKKIKSFDMVLWNSKVNGVLQKGLMEKFKQNPSLHSKFMATGDNVIVEANQFDSKYGIVLSLSKIYGVRRSGEGKTGCGKHLWM